MKKIPTHRDYQVLAEFRFVIRSFLEFSEAAAARLHLTPRQHQALLAIAGQPKGEEMTVGRLAQRLCIKPNSAAELADRLEEARLIERHQDLVDQRRVYLRLTDDALQRLSDLSQAHLDELSRCGPVLIELLTALHPNQPAAAREQTRLTA